MKSNNGLMILALGVLTACASGPQQRSGAKNQQQANQNLLQNTGEFDESDQAKPKSDDDDEAAATAAPTSKSEMDALYNQFNAARMSNDNQAAQDFAGKILARNPNDVRVINALAIMAIEQNKLDLARLLLAKVIEKNPHAAAAYNNLGLIEMKSNNLRLALVNFKKATELDLSNRAAHANLGAIYLSYRNYSNAATELKAAQSNGDKSLGTLSNLGYALSMSGDVSGAESAYKSALDQDPNNPTLMLNYASLLINRKKDMDAGLKLINKIRFSVHDPDILDKAESLARKANVKANGNAKSADLSNSSHGEEKESLDETPDP